MFRKLAQRGSSSSKFKKDFNASKVLAGASSMISDLDALPDVMVKNAQRDALAVENIQRSIESLQEESQEVLKVYKNVT